MDSEELKAMGAKYGRLGTLQVEITRATIRARVQDYDYGGKQETDEAVPEKALKGRSLTVAAKQVFLTHRGLPTDVYDRMKSAGFMLPKSTLLSTPIQGAKQYIVRFLYRTRGKVTSLVFLQH